MVEPIHVRPEVILYLSDCLMALRQLKTASIHSVVTDPPAGINFLNLDWDKDKGGRDAWISWMQEIAVELLRVLMPGGHAVVWALPKTSHWTALAFDNAGFEIRERVAHLFGQGFPKSHNLKGEWNGWGTALKPAFEDWYIFRKPLDGTVAKNMDKYGVGAFNIDACRVPTDEDIPINVLKSWSGFGQEKQPEYDQVISNKGRWPANMVHDGSQAVVDQFPIVSSGTSGKRRSTGKSVAIRAVLRGFSTVYHWTLMILSHFSISRSLTEKKRILESYRQRENLLQ